MNETAEMIRARMTSAFKPEFLSIEDESHLHAGHAGARAGGGHFRMTIVSIGFEGKSRLERHRAIHEALRGEMGGRIHALAITALSPSEHEGGTSRG